MSTADTLPEKESFVLVRFQYGASREIQEFYTNLDASYGNFESVPTMEFTLPPNEGGISERTAKLYLPADTFTERLSNGIVTSPTFMYVQEISRPAQPSAGVTKRVLYSGRVTKATRNYQGRQGLVAIFSKPLKSRLDIPMGLPCNHQCHLTFAEGSCTANPLVSSLTISGIDGTLVTGTVSPDRSGSDATYYHRGKLVGTDGVRLTIRKWDLVDPTKFYLSSAPPQSWLGTSVIINGGCDKTIETCRDRWANEAQFSGYGYSIPPYNPVLENPY
jgi:hypothetical protein